MYSKQDKRLSMYSREKRTKAIELYIKYDKSVADVRHDLGYPDYKTLTRWYDEHLKEEETGVLWKRHTRCPKFTLEQKVAAEEYYREHGHNLSRTIRKLEYPSRGKLREWCKELTGTTRKRCVASVKYTHEQKKECVMALCTRTGSAKGIAMAYGVTREALYKWKNDLLAKGIAYQWLG